MIQRFNLGFNASIYDSNDSIYDSMIQSIIQIISIYD